MEESRFFRDLSEAQMKYPSMNYVFIEGFEYPHLVKGEIDIIDREGTPWGTFPISVYFHLNYPKGFAILRDRSEVFPWEEDWHISKHGECCVCSPLEKIEQSHSRITVLSFLEDYVIPFYSNQIYRREFGSYKNGSYSHHLEGVWESLEEEFNTKDRKEIREILNRMGRDRGRNDPCFCSSGKKFKHCHLQKKKVLEELSKTL